MAGITGGLQALSFLQASLETTAGTALAATRVEPILGGWLRESFERNFPDEQRASFIAHYRNFALKRYVEISGLQIAPTYEGIGWWCNLLLDGTLATGTPPVIRGVTSDTTVETMTFRNRTTNTLATATMEMGDDTQGYQVPFVIGSKFELGWGASQPMTLSVDLLGQRAIPATKTAALTAGAYEDIIGATSTAKIDTTTINTTAVTNVLDAKITIDNGWMHDFTLDGNIYPGGAHRSKTRYAQLEATLQFVNTTEYLIYQNSGIGTPRKIRLNTTGTAIAGSGAGVRTFYTDWYGVWETAEFDSVDGQHVVKFTGRSQYDTSATYDWLVSVASALCPLP